MGKILKNINIVLEKEIFKYILFSQQENKKEALKKKRLEILERIEKTLRDLGYENFKLSDTNNLYYYISLDIDDSFYEGFSSAIKKNKMGIIMHFIPVHFMNMKI